MFPISAKLVTTLYTFQILNSKERCCTKPRAQGRLVLDVRALYTFQIADASIADFYSGRIEAHVIDEIKLRLHFKLLSKIGSSWKGEWTVYCELKPYPLIH